MEYYNKQGDKSEEFGKMLLDLIRDNQEELRKEATKELIKQREELERKKKEFERKDKKVPFKNSCARCGTETRPLAEGSRNGIFGKYCMDVWKCEWDAWRLPCCQYCHEQFHPEVHTICKQAPMDPFGNQPHIAGGKFLTFSQKADRGGVEEALEEHEKTQEALKDFERVSEKLRKLREISEEPAYFCEVCGRTSKPLKPTKCLECSKKMGWRKGYVRKDYNPDPYDLLKLKKKYK